jgi:hypothetical protein
MTSKKDPVEKNSKRHFMTPAPIPYHCSSAFLLKHYYCRELVTLENVDCWLARVASESV